MKGIVQALEQVSRSAKSDKETVKPADAVKELRKRIRDGKPKQPAELQAMLAQLDEELAVWESKIAVIMKEPVGRQGMARHAAHWAERLGGNRHGQ